jgi:hypothetical protein
MMNIKRMLLASAVLALALLVVLTSSVFASTPVSQAAYEVKLPATSDGTIDYSGITNVVANYFTCYYLSLEKLSVAPELGNYVADTDETHLCLDALQYGINWRKQLNTGVADTKLELVDVKYAKQSDSGAIDVRAYVKVEFRYVDDKSGTMASVGDLWDIGLDRVNGALQIVSLNCGSSDYYYAKQLVAENLRKNAANVAAKTYTKTDAIDAAYDEINARIALIKPQLDIPLSPPADVSEQGGGGMSPLSVGVAYDGARAGLYGASKGNYYDTLIFHNMEDGGYGDCTNFVSQCLWAGYGGDQGNNWFSDSGVAACIDLAYANFRQIGGSSGWWGKSQHSSWGLSSTHWMRVVELYDSITMTSAGPRANKYNNGLRYDTCSTTVQRGYVLQLSHTSSSGSYFHSVMVTSANVPLSAASSIYEAQHSSNYSYRQLLECIASNSAPYVRIIRPITGSFPS